jgi:hypothetical protein
MKKELKIKDSDFAKMEKVYTPRNKYVSKGLHLYFSYGVRIFLMFFAIIVIAIVSYLNYVNSFSKSTSVSMPYEVSGEIDYNVTLLPGNPFETGNLSAVNTYIADYIDDIGTDFVLDYAVELEERLKEDSVRYIEENETRIGVRQIGFCEGDKVQHKVFGPGEIVGVRQDTAVLVVKFEKFETVRNLSFDAPLTKV